MTLRHRGIRFEVKSLEKQGRFAAVLKAEVVTVDEIKRQVAAGAECGSRVLAAGVLVYLLKLQWKQITLSGTSWRVSQVKCLHKRQRKH